MPHYEKVNFDHGEGERTINIDIINERHPQIQSKTIGSAKVDNEDDQDDGEKPNLMFKVKIEKAEPSIVKVSKKNICYVTIDQNEQEDNVGQGQAELIKFFINSKDKSWGQ